MTTQTGRRRVSDLERLALAAFVDPLTGLRNRRGLDRDLEQALALARRGERPLTVVVGDLDGLKEINDREGHAAGDRALRALGVALESALRAGDAAYRIGGDEFLLVLADTGAAEADAVVARVRTTAPAFSCGQATFPADGEDGTSLMELADQRLLSGRRQTRTRRGGHRARGTRTEWVRSGSRAFAVATLTVTALLGGVGVGFAAQNVMAGRESVRTPVRNTSIPTGVPLPAVESGDAVAVSPASPTEDGLVSGQSSAPTTADQAEVAATVEPSPLGDVTGLTTVPPPDPASVVDVVEETAAEPSDEPQPQQEPHKEPRGDTGDGKPGNGPK